MALSMSVSAGKHNARHNTNLAYRAKLPNVDPKLSHLNFAIRDEPIKEAYNRVFGATTTRSRSRRGMANDASPTTTRKSKGLGKRIPQKSIATRRAARTSRSRATNTSCNSATVTLFAKSSITKPRKRFSRNPSIQSRRKLRALSTGSKSRRTSTSLTERGTSICRGFRTERATGVGLKNRCP